MARVWPTEEAMDEQLAAELPSGNACVLGDTELTWDGLIDELIAAAPPRRPLDAVSERLALRAACAAVVPGDAAASRGFLAAVARALGELRRAGVAAVTEPLPARPRRVLDVHEEMARRCARLGSPRDERRALAARALAGAPLAVLDVEPRLVWEPADVELVLALARHARVRVKLCWAPDRPSIYAGVEDVLRAFEAKGAGLDLELSLEDPAERGCARGLVAALYRTGAQAPAPRGPPAVTLVAAPHPVAEARALAARIRRLVDEGTAPEAIAVAVRQPGGGEIMALELERAGLPTDERWSRPLAAAPPARLALALLGLPERGWLREEVLALLCSGYVTPGVDAAACTRLARSLGVRELSPDGEALRRMAAVPPPSRPAEPPLPDGARLAGGLRAFLAPVAALPETASAGEHATALRVALRGLGVHRRAGAFDPTLGDSAIDRRIERAVARDGEAMALLDGLLARIPAAAADVGLDGPMARRAFAALLTDLMEETRQRTGGARGGAVRIVLLEDLAARAFDHVFVPGLVDGQAPARALDDGVWAERERREVNAALGARALPTAAGKSDGSERTPFELLLLVNALAAARRGIVLSYPRTADDRPLERSPFVDELLRAAPWLSIVEVPLSPIPSLSSEASALATADVLAAVALEALGDPQGRLPPRPRAPDADALLDELGARLPARVARLRALAAVERARWRYFAGVEPAGPWVGMAGELAALRAGGGSDAPIPARQLELLAGCPFTYLAGRVLGTQQLEETEDAPTPQSLGRLAHRCLEIFYKQRGLAGALPLRGGDEDRAALAAACAQVFAAAEALGVRGHPLLWKLGKERLVEDLWRTVAGEAESGRGGVPTYFELPFGLSGRGGPSLPALALAGLHASGRIDRVDVVPGGHLVVDYKLGRNPGQKLRDAGATELQLPIYAAAVQRGLGGHADAAYVSLRDGTMSRTLSAALGAAEASTLLGQGLEQRFAELGARVRSGAFEVAPADDARCLWCAFRTACRVVRREQEEES